MRRARGIKASCRPSPRKLVASTTTRMARPGKRVSQGLVAIVVCASISMLPHVGVGGCTPRPRKLSDGLDEDGIAPRPGWPPR